MSDNWKLQVSPKLADGTLINLRAETPEEFDTVVGWATANAAKFVSVVAAINAVPPSLAANIQPGSVQVQYDQPPTQQNNPGWGAPQDTPPPSWSQPAQQAPTCQHGPMVFRTGTSAKGPWSGHFCPTPKGTPGQCDPRFPPRGR